MTRALPEGGTQGQRRASPRTLKLIFYVGIPTLMATISGLRSPMGSVPASVVFWISQGIPCWLVMAAASELWFRLLRPWRPAPVVILVLGALLGGGANLVLQAFISPIESKLVLGMAFPYGLPKPDWTWSFAGAIARMILWQSLMWVAASAFYDLALGIPRYRYAPAPTAAVDESTVVPDTDEPRLAPVGPLWSRLPEGLGRDVLAMRAQEHYVAVTTSLGSALILCRFSDALRDVAHLDGLCVHRSHWISRRSVVAMIPERGGFRLTLADGGVARVSQSRKLMFEHWLAGGEGQVAAQ